MRIVIGYPPLKSPKGYPFIGQNRQFQWGTTPWTAYPMVPAMAATLLKQAGHEVYWLDGIWEKWDDQKWEEELMKINPDVLAIETKTPVVKMHWQLIDRLKTHRTPYTDHCTPTIVLFGDHVTALPQESMENSKVDYVLTGGDYDFLLLNLVEHLINPKVQLEPGLWYRDNINKQQTTRFAREACFARRARRANNNQQTINNTGQFQLKHDLSKLPPIDRDLTKWKLYAYENSNYWRLPGSYTMFGRDCWWGRCSFCSWTTLYPGSCFRSTSAAKALDEVGTLIENFGIKEIMDDSGSFPVGKWMKEFCEGMISRGYNKKVRLSINMRFNAGLTREDYLLMGKAGFRFILYGLESVNQKTLDRINKNSTVEIIEPTLRWAKEAGLSPHLTAMVGYPWETKQDAVNTLEFAKKMFQKGLADTLQATIVIPYPGTPLFAQAKKEGWLKTEDWNRYDMREPILKTEMSDEEIKGLVQGFFLKSVFNPQFFFRKLKEGLTSWENFQYYFRFGLKFISKMMDFKK